MSSSNATAAQQDQTPGAPIDQLLGQDGEVEAVRCHQIAVVRTLTAV